MSSKNSSLTLRPTISTSEPQLPTQPTHPALLLTDILDEIFSHIGTPHELLQLRLVCRKWNDVICHTLVTKCKNCFPLRLRYRPQVPLSHRLRHHDAQPRARDTRDILAHPPIITLTGTDGKTPSLSFDTLVVECDFYLGAVNPEWQHFLETYKESIRHMTFNIQNGRVSKLNPRQVNCTRIVSRENLRTAISAVPNLESLDFSISFTRYRSLENYMMSSPERMFSLAFGPRIIDLHQLDSTLPHLTKITFQEPRGVQYDEDFLREILGTAPNLTTLYIKWLHSLSTYADALRSLPHLNNSLKTLGISMSDRSTRFTEYLIHESGFSRFHLTKLELNSITGTGINLEPFLQSQSSTLTTLILGDRVTPNPDPRSFHGPFGRSAGVTVAVPLVIRTHVCRPLYSFPLRLPPIMDSLKILEVNLPKFTLVPITRYPNQFPALEELTLSNCEETGCVWAYQHIQHMLPGDIGQSHTLEKFSLLGPIGDADRDTIISAVSSTFPVAELHFGL